MQKHKDGRDSDGALEHGFVQVMAATLTGLLVEVVPRCGEDPLPSEVTARVRVLPMEGSRQLHPAGTAFHVGGVLPGHPSQLPLQAFPGADRQDRDAIPPALAVSDHDLGGPEVQALDPQSGTFEQGRSKRPVVRVGPGERGRSPRASRPVGMAPGRTPPAGRTAPAPASTFPRRGFGAVSRPQSDRSSSPRSLPARTPSHEPVAGNTVRECGPSANESGRSGSRNSLAA